MSPLWLIALPKRLCFKKFFDMLLLQLTIIGLTPGHLLFSEMRVLNYETKVYKKRKWEIPSLGDTSPLRDGR
jgi:hypothetical protein